MGQPMNLCVASSLLHPPNFKSPLRRPSIILLFASAAFFRLPTHTNNQTSQPTNQPHDSCTAPCTAAQRPLWTLNHNSCPAKDVVGRWRRSSLSFYSPNSFPFFSSHWAESFHCVDIPPWSCFSLFVQKHVPPFFCRGRGPPPQAKCLGQCRDFMYTTTLLLSRTLATRPMVEGRGRYRMREGGVARPSGVGFTVAGNHRWQPSVLHLPSEPLCSFCESLKKTFT